MADAFALMLSQRSLYGLRFEGDRYDTGDKLGFLKATVDFALEDPVLGPQFAEFLKHRAHLLSV